ncbi:MAG: beta-lactamase family protein [Candidatus Eremiobacteraeota bacterium]|nr:beta-lactamase family protein [Candidatus Eremiobacteraeota bacterium]
MRKLLALVCMLATLAFGRAVALGASQHAFTPKMAAMIDRLARAEATGGRTPGLAVAVVEDGRWVYARGFGYANLAKKRAVTATTEFYVGSLTKEFTAASVLLLVQDGKVKLDDKVTKYVPELTIASNVSVAQLLQQTSGLPDYVHAPGILPDPTRNVKLADFIAAVDRLPLRFAPGSKFEYNNFNYFIAGLIVERASGLPLSDFFQARIFQPLSMSSSFVAGDTGISPEAATGYTGGAHRFIPAKPWDPSWLLGAGGIVTNVYDMAKWDIGFPILVRDDAVRNMFTAPDVPGAQSYGMGWVIDQRSGKRYVWHNGEIGGFHAMNALLPDDHIAVIVLANTDALHGDDGAIAPEYLAAQILDIVAPPAAVRVENAIVSRAKEWLGRLADKNVDRTQLTPQFSAFLTDELVSHANIKSYGKLLAIVPISSKSGDDGSTVYEFLVRFKNGQYHYHFGVTNQSKIDELLLSP